MIANWLKDHLHEPWVAQMIENELGLTNPADSQLWITTYVENAANLATDDPAFWANEVVINAAAHALSTPIQVHSGGVVHTYNEGAGGQPLSVNHVAAGGAGLVANHYTLNTPPLGDGVAAPEWLTNSTSSPVPAGAHTLTGSFRLRSGCLPAAPLSAFGMLLKPQWVAR